MLKSTFVGVPSRVSVGVFAFAVTILGGLVAFVRATFPAVLGQAPHPDGDRYLCQLGSDDVKPVLVDAPRYWDYALLQWHHTGVPASHECISYPSSQVPLLKALEWFSSMVSGHPGTLDFTWLIVANSLFIGVVTGLLALAPRRASLLARSIACAALVAIVSDPIFSAYAAGPMGEYVGLVGVVLLGVGTAFYASPGARQPVGIAMVAAGGLLLLTSKVQAITVLVPIAIMLLSVPVGTWWSRRSSRGGFLRVLGVIASRVAGAVLIAAFVVAGLWVLSNNPKKFQQINAWELISVGILGHSQTPGDDLVEMGFPRGMDKYAGRTAGDADSVMHTPEWQTYAQTMTYGTVLAFLAHHPDRVWPIVNVAATDFAVGQPQYLGANQPGMGPARQPAFSPMAAIGKAGGGIVEFMGVGLMATVAALIAWRRAGPRSSGRAFATAALLMIGVTFTQFFTAAFGEAIENTKHLVFAILASALVVLFIGMAFLELMRDDRTNAVAADDMDADTDTSARSIAEPDQALA